MVRSRPIFAAVLGALLLVAGACSSSGDGGPGGGPLGKKPSDPALVPYAEAITASILDDEADDSLDLSDEQATCLGIGFANTIGIERFESNGVTPEDIRAGEEFGDGLEMEDRGAAEELYGVVGSCGIDFRDLIITEMADSSPETVECFENVLTDDLVEELFIASFMDEEPDDALFAPVLGCAFLAMGDAFEDIGE